MSDLSRDFGPGGVRFFLVNSNAGDSAAAVAHMPSELKVIDVGGDHRFVDGWTYGLTEVTGPAAIASLQGGCDGAAGPPASTSVSFASGGRVWAFSPDDPSNLHCLFTQADAGALSWGPRGDRVILAGLQVKGVGSTAARPAGDFHPAYFTWSRPSGTTIWFTAGSRTSVFRADIGSASASEVTPLPNVTYGDMAYHPSGLGVGFVSSDARGRPFDTRPPRLDDACGN